MTMIWNSVLCLTTRLSQQVYDDRFELVAIVVPSPQVSQRFPAQSRKFAPPEAWMSW